MRNVEKSIFMDNAFHVRTKKKMISMLSTLEVSKKLHMGINQTRQLIRRKDFPKIIIGKRKYLIPENELENWISRNLYKDLSK